MALARMPIRDAEAGSRRLPIDDGNYWDFEALLRLPYDLFKPVYELLCAGVIFIEDLRPTDVPRRLLAERALAELRQSFPTRADLSVPAFMERLTALLERGERPGYIAVAFDASSVGTEASGAPGPFVGTADIPGSTDYDVQIPNAIQKSRAEEAGEDARKAAQMAFSNSIYRGSP